MSRKMRYDHDLDFSTNSPSYYQSLMKFTKSLKLLTERMNDVEKRFKDLLIEWGEDGTLNEYVKGEKGDTPIPSFRINEKGELLYKVEYRKED